MLICVRYTGAMGSSDLKVVDVTFMTVFVPMRDSAYP